MKFLLTLLLPLAAITTSHAQIYADFQTSLGDFTCELNYTASPKTVANFIGLAEGTRTWIDPSNGSLRENTRFYDGLTFHRVAAGFVNQAGCPLGTGTSSPGYFFPDETANGLIHAPYLLSMANAGANTNGAQFFVTVPRPAPLDFTHLDGNHTVFGTVVSGKTVVDQINAVPVENANTGKPVTPVVIQQVAIRRVGAAAVAFAVPASQMPSVSLVSYGLQIDPAFQFAKAVPIAPRGPGTMTYTFSSDDLVKWSQGARSYQTLGPSSMAPFTIATPLGFATSIGSKGFYRFSQSFHPDAFVPTSLSSRTLRVDWQGQYLTFSFNAAGNAGTVFYSHDGLTRNVTQIYAFTSPYDLIFDVTGFGSLKISGALASETPASLIANHKIQQWNGGWNTLGHGTATLSK